MVGIEQPNLRLLRLKLSHITQQLLPRPTHSEDTSVSLYVNFPSYLNPPALTGRVVVPDETP